jgi:F-type H+-transporting ATPase subunit a
MIMASGFSWFSLIPGVEGDGLIAAMYGGVENIPPNAVGGAGIFVAACFVSVLLISFAFLANRALVTATAKGGTEAFQADETLTIRNIAEIIISTLSGLFETNFTKKDLRLFLPLLGTFFLFIWIANMLGLVPGLLPPTDNINTNIGIALVVFVLFNVVGLKRDAKSYVGHLWGPIFITGFLLFPIELVSLIFRPVSLTLRLTGNMFGDHTVFSVMSNLLPNIAAEAQMGPVVEWIAFFVPVPLPFLGLALLVSTVQAIVFTLLSATYIGTAIPHADHH